MALPRYYLFLFIREPEEIEKLIKSYEKGKFKTVCVVRGEDDNQDDDQDNITNHADKYVYAFKYDYVIYNTETLDDFKQSAENFYKTVIKK